MQDEISYNEDEFKEFCIRKLNEINRHCMDDSIAWSYIWVMCYEDVLSMGYTVCFSDNDYAFGLERHGEEVYFSWKPYGNPEDVFIFAPCA